MTTLVPEQPLSLEIFGKRRASRWELGGARVKLLGQRMASGSDTSSGKPITGCSMALISPPTGSLRGAHTRDCIDLSFPPIP